MSQTAASAVIITALLFTGAQKADAAISSEAFVEKATIANLFEIESSKLALDKSHDHTVRKFAERMIDDHEKASDKLEETLEVSDVDMELPTTLDQEHRATLDKLRGISTEDEFNRQYVAAQARGHEQAVSMFRDYAKNGKDEALREFAKDVLLTLESHHEGIKEIKTEEMKTSTQ